MNPCAHCKKLFKKAYSKQKFCCLGCSNRYNLNNKKSIILPKKYSAELAELFGILLGDGSVTAYYTKIYLNRIADKGFSKNILRIIAKLSPGLRVKVTDLPHRGVEELQISSKDFCDYLRSIGFNPKERSIPSWILKNNIFTKATLRGIFDTEGSIGIKYFQGKKGNYIYRQLTVTNKNKNILAFLEQSLEKFGFSPTKNSTKNIYLSNKKDIDRYFKVVGTSNPKLVKKAKIG